MATRWIERVTGTLQDKKRYRAYKARTQQLPANYRTAIGALCRYLTYFGAISKGDVLVSMLEDLADLFEQSAASGTPIRDVRATHQHHSRGLRLIHWATPIRSCRRCRWRAERSSTLDRSPLSVRALPAAARVLVRSRAGANAGRHPIGGSATPADW